MWTLRKCKVDPLCVCSLLLKIKQIKCKIIFKYYLNFSSEKSNPLPSTSSYKGKSQQQQPPQQTGKYGSNASNSNAPETKVSKNQQINSSLTHQYIYVYGDHNLSSEINESKSTKTITTIYIVTLTNTRTYETYYESI